MQADAQTLHKNILARLEAYKHQINKEMSTPAIAQMLSTMLYHNLSIKKVSRAFQPLATNPDTTV